MREVVVYGEGEAVPAGFCRVFEIEVGGRRRHVVDSRDLHACVGAGDGKVRRWAREMIDANGMQVGEYWDARFEARGSGVGTRTNFVRVYETRTKFVRVLVEGGKDWIIPASPGSRGPLERFYLLTLAAAKMIGVMARTPQGLLLRRYLVSVEDRLSDLVEADVAKRIDAVRAEASAPAPYVRPAPPKRSFWEADVTTMTLRRYLETKPASPAHRRAIGDWAMEDMVLRAGRVSGDPRKFCPDLRKPQQFCAGFRWSDRWQHVRSCCW